MSVRDTVRKVAGLFVEMDPDTGYVSSPGLADPASAQTAAPRPQKTIEQLVRDAPGPNLDEISPTVSQESADLPVISSDGKVSFEAIYKMAKLPQEAFTAENVLELFAQLPAELPIESKRATLKVTLGAMSKTSGVTIESVLADASRKLAALASYSESHEKQAQSFVAASEQQIAQLQSQIASIKRAIEDAKTRSTGVSQACESESNRLDDVVEFFSLDKAPSKHAP
ncbi:MAG: hypothetical protein HZC36_12005 [Armatimonadetes bacterium]|nr:hypothetical protein [Armatimonadota bacterium]